VAEPAEWIPGTGQVVFTATGPNQLAFEDGNLGHALFTAALLDGLQGRAAGKFGVVTATDLFSFIKERMSAYSKRLGIEQSPVMYSTAHGELALAPGRLKR
jgi:helicase